MGSTTLKEHKARVSTFSVDKLGVAWLKSLPIGEVDKTLAEKLGSQNIAGYQYFNALSRTHPDHPEVTDEDLEIRNILIEFYDRGPVWEVHSLTRVGELRHLDQNILNLMYKLYTNKTIDIMKKNNWISGDVKLDPSALAYQSWNENTFDKYTDYIFKDVGTGSKEDVARLKLTKKYSAE